MSSVRPVGSGTRWALVVVGAAAAAQVARLGRLAPVLLAGALVAGNLAVVRWQGRRAVAGGFDPRWLAGPLGAAWLLVTLLPLHTFSHRPVTAGAPGVDAEAVLQVLGSLAAAAVAVLVVRAFEPTLDRMRPPVALFLLPVWTAVSCLWSPTGPYALVRGVQLMVLGLLAWATVALGRVDPGAVREMVEVVLRWFVRITFVLIALGVLFGPLYVSASEANLERFTWMGAHPLASGMVISVALVIVLAVPAQVLRVPRWARAGAVVGLVAALVPNHSRQSWLGLALAVVVGLGLGGHLTRAARWVGGPILGAAVVGGIAFRGPQLWDYLLRNEDSDKLSSGNGRLELWGIGFDALHSPLQWLIGLGHGVTRTLFVAEAPWARSAHSSILAAIVSLGLIGLLTLVAVLGTTIAGVARSRLWAAGPAGFALVLALVLVLVNGLVSDNLVIPNIGSGLLWLVAAVARSGFDAVTLRGSPPVAVGRPSVVGSR
jgi:O-antigen ligase